ncbi:hypothetical protein QAZ47_28560 [Mesorhizobium sp. WSM4904]|nr:hypothetical protein [Mesorhizobium sp. WSM4904]WFP62358.1 hypothetical protein QAZ47_28560 [Mesorhizobium sp. WSM4904]
MARAIAPAVTDTQKPFCGPKVSTVQPAAKETQRHADADSGRHPGDASVSIGTWRSIRPKAVMKVGEIATPLTKTASASVGTVSVLGDPAQWPNANACTASMTDHLTALQEEGVVVPDLDPETAARLINGASSQASQRIANSRDPEATSKKAIAAFKQLLEGLRKSPDRTIG